MRDSHTRKKKTCSLRKLSCSLLLDFPSGALSEAANQKTVGVRRRFAQLSADELRPFLIQSARKSRENLYARGEDVSQARQLDFVGVDDLLADALVRRTRANHRLDFVAVVPWGRCPVVSLLPRPFSVNK